MTKKKLLAAALIAASFGAVTLAPAPAVAADIYVQVAPPAPRYEVVPAPRRGYVWAPGHWEWNGHRYTWIGGSWIRERRGYRYYQPEWVERNGRWHYERRGWQRDRDHDGVPNRYDRDRDNDGVPNNRDRDRDNDGVPNRYDSRPDNPNRR
jgi:hypothetical protein